MPRKKKFTIPEVLARAVRRFSMYGYHASSIRDLVLAMGIQRGSMYDTFASKRGLFLSALRHHLEAEGNVLQQIVERFTSPTEALMALAERVANDRFLVRPAVELASHDDEIGQTVAEAHREVACLFEALIERGQSAGEIDGAVDPVVAGSALLGLCIGIGVIGNPAELRQQGRELVPAPAGERG